MIEDLHPVLHSVDHPNMVVAVDGNALRPGKVSRAVAGLAEHADEFAVAIEYLNAIIQSISYIKIALLVNCQTRWPGEIAGRSEFVFVPAGANPALQLQRIRVVHQNLI